MKVAEHRLPVADNYYMKVAECYTRLSTLEPDGNDTSVEDYFLIKSYAFFKSS